jgi:hypothetical protein
MALENLEVIAVKEGVLGDHMLPLTYLTPLTTLTSTSWISQPWQ